VKHSTDVGEVDIYAVGLLHDIRLAVGGLRARGHRFHFARKLPRRLRSSWRKSSYWNGYLAEPAAIADGLNTWTRCGHGWTKKRALRDLRRHMRELAGGDSSGK
jgi:hypothetical protein